MAFVSSTNQQTRRSVLRGIAIGTTSIAGLAAASSTATAHTRPEREEDSEYDWEVFTADELGRIELRVHERFADLGPNLLRLARWAQEITQEYRSLDYTGLCRIWLYPPDGEAMREELGFTGGLASGGGPEMDLYMTHPPGYAIEDILTASDPRLEHGFFRTLMHEYIHAESYWLMSGFPGWFEHGFTEYTTKNNHVAYYQTVQEHIDNDELMTLEEVDEETPGGYTYGLFVMKYLVQAHGIEAVTDIYDEMASNHAIDRNVRTEASFESVLGIPFDEFEAGFRETVRNWFSDMDSVPGTIDGRIIHPDDYLSRERGEVGINIGSPPEVDYESTTGDTGAEETSDEHEEEIEALEERLTEKREELSDAEDQLERKNSEIRLLEIDLERKRETIEEHEERVTEVEQQLEDERRPTETPDPPENDTEGSTDRKDQAAWGAGGVISGGGVVYLASKHGNWFGQLLNR